MKNNKQKLNLFTFLMLLFFANLSAQIVQKFGDNSFTIDSNAVLELESTNKGLLLPRVALTSTSSISPMTGTLTSGMTVYNTATAGDVTPGFYYYSVNKWVRVADSSSVPASSITGTLGVANGGTGVTTSTGSGSVVLSTSPTLTSPNLGTPTALVGTNITGTAAGLSIGGNAATVTTNANLTGPITSVGNTTSVASQTGTGSKFVMDTSPTLVTPILGVATGTSLSVSGQLTSTVATGTAPLVVTSTTPVANLSIGGNAATATSATTATNATNTGITEDLLTAVAVYPTFVTANTGNLPQKVTSTKLSFIPSTGILTATGFSGNGANLTNVMATSFSGTLPVANGGTGVTTSTGTGSVVLSTSPTLVTPVLGAATGTSLSVSGQLTSTVATGTAPFVVTSTTPVANLSIGGNAATVTTNANLTGAITSTGNATSLGSFTSANLATALSDETGTGVAVLATSPTLVTPVLGVATATSINSTIIPTSKTLVVTSDKLSVMSATTSAELAGVISDETGTGAVVLAASPTFTGTPTLPTGTIATTQTAGNSSTAIATTAFVTNAVNLPPVVAKTTDYTATTTDSTILYDTSGATAAGLTLTIPAAAAGNNGKVYIIKKDASNIKLNFTPSLNLTSTVTISSLNYAKTIRIQSDGTRWNIID